MSNIEYKKWYTSQNESLIAPGDVFELLDKVDMVIDIANDTKVLFSPLSSLILIEEDIRIPKHERFSKIDPDYLSNPIFWLPDNALKRYEFEMPDGSIELESDDTFCLRTAYQIQNSELYDKETGGWLDILALNNLDFQNLDDLKRIASWQISGNDELLDSISLDKYFPDPRKALSWAISNLEKIQNHVMPKFTKEFLDRLVSPDFDKLETGEIAQMVGVTLYNKIIEPSNDYDELIKQLKGCAG